MDAWKIRRTEQGGLTEKGHPSHSKGSQFLTSSSLASHIGRSEPDRSFTGSTSSIDRWAAERVQAERDELVRERAAELAPRIVEAFGDAFAGDNSRDALKGLISVLANEILTFTGCVNEEVWHPVSLWIRLYNCANVQHPLQHAGGIISLLSRCKEHGLAAAFPDNWANGPMYWSADADEEFANRTSLATLRDRWISQLHDPQANGGYSWPWLAESFDLHHVGSGVRHQYQKCRNAASWEEIEEFWDYSNGDRYFLDLEFDKDWALHQFTEKVYQQCRPIGL